VISSSNNPGLRTLAALIQIEFEDLYLKWGQSQPPRTGLHASSLLVSDQEWCTRKHVLAEIFSDEVRNPELARWQWKQQAVFENGWDVHKRWQKMFAKFGKVVWTPISDEQASDITYSIPPALFKYYLKLVGSQWFAAELDLTHYDETRQVYFSPDIISEFAGEQYPVEIKGINHDSFQSLTSNLDQARKACETVDKAVIQANLYLHLLQLDHTIILIEDKNNQEFKVWIVEYDRSMALPYVQRAYHVKGGLVHAKHGRYPDRVCQTIDDPLARKCPMRECCFSEKMER